MQDHFLALVKESGLLHHEYSVVSSKMKPMRVGTNWVAEQIDFR